MKYYSERINRLITQLSMLPGIGQRTAERLAYHIVKLPKERAAALADSIRDASENVFYCKTCFATSDEEMCPVCRSQNRNHRLIMVVENDDDMAQMERSGAYDGIYHVLQGAIDPMKGIGPDKIRLKELMLRLRDDVDEIILARPRQHTSAVWSSRLASKSHSWRPASRSERICRQLIQRRLPGLLKTGENCKTTQKRREKWY